MIILPIDVNQTSNTQPKLATYYTRNKTKQVIKS